MIAKFKPGKVKGKVSKEVKAELSAITTTIAKLKKVYKASIQKKDTKIAKKNKKIKALTKKLAKAKGGSLKLKGMNDPNVGGKGKGKGIGAEIVSNLSARQKKLLKENPLTRD